MRKIFTTLLLILSCCLVFAQDAKKQGAILYIVDNVPILDDPDDASGTLNNDDVAELTVVTDKDKIKQAGYSVDKIIYITTKDYKNRPDEIKNIPTTKLMQKKNGAWFLTGVATSYTGKFIDYFANGKEQGEGTLKNGIIDGVRTVYYPNGNKRYFYTYTNGLEDGESEEYFINGKLKQKGSFILNSQTGVWLRYYSTGGLKDEITYVKGKPVLTKDIERFYNLMDKAKALLQEEDYKAAVKKLDEAEKLNDKYSDLYFKRGNAKFNDFDFDNAILDFDKVIGLEPLYSDAIVDRAFARIRKYEFKNSRTLTKNSEVTVLATKDKVEIPPEDLAKICADLQKSYELGYTKPMLLDAMKTYCK